MAKAYKTVGADSVIVFQRDDGGYGSDVSIKTNGFVDCVPITTAFSRPLSTEELGEIAAHCALIYFRRTGKVPLPPCEPPFTSVVFAEREPTPEGEAPQIDTSACPHCLDECTGECL